MESEEILGKIRTEFSLQDLEKMEQELKKMPFYIPDVFKLEEEDGK